MQWIILERAWAVGRVASQGAAEAVAVHVGSLQHCVDRAGCPVGPHAQGARQRHRLPQQGTKGLDAWKARLGTVVTKLLSVLEGTNVRSAFGAAVLAYVL